MSATVEVGQVWHHIGNDEIEGTGLRLRIVHVDPPDFYAVYGRDPKPRRYFTPGFTSMYELEAAVPVGDCDPDHTSGASLEGNDRDTGAALRSSAVSS